MIGKRLRKIIQQLPLIFCVLSERKEGWHSLTVKTICITNRKNFYCLTVIA